MLKSSVRSEDIACNGLWSNGHKSKINYLLIFDGTPYMMKVVRTVWTGGKIWCNFKVVWDLPIGIANNAFKRAAYGLIDYYLEEEKELRRRASRLNWDEKVLDTKLDEMWGKVTLYNTYQLFVQLTSRKLKNPAVEFVKDAKEDKYADLSDDEYNYALAEAEQKSKLWEDKPELDMLTLYFNATDALPMNSMRRLVSNANNALRSMSGAEKMMAS